VGTFVFAHERGRRMADGGARRGSDAYRRDAEHGLPVRAEVNRFQNFSDAAGLSPQCLRVAGWASRDAERTASPSEVERMRAAPTDRLPFATEHLQLVSPRREKLLGTSFWSH